MVVLMRSLHLGATRRIALCLLLASCRDSGGLRDPRGGAGTIRIPNGAVTIAGTLDLPSTPGAHPVMIFVPGSGRTTRGDDTAAVRIALPRGVAVFRYDKRGLGESTGTFEEVTTDNSERVIAERASDVLAIVNHLSTLPQLQRDRIILWGTSQGAWVAPLVAGQTTKVAFVIAVVGGGSPVGTVIEYERQLRDASVSISEGMRRATLPGVVKGYDPAPVLRVLKVPVYWIFGGEDRNTPTNLDIPRLEALRAATGADFTIRRYDRMNHNLTDLSTGTYPVTLFPDLFAWASARITGAR
jgi:hypothetical protein